MGAPRPQSAHSWRMHRWREQAGRIERDALTLYFASRDPRTPLYVRVLAAGMAAYVLSPIDLIPDFVPVLGLVDELILVPAGVAVVVRLLPDEVVTDARIRALASSDRPTSRAAFVFVLFILSLWLLVAMVVGRTVVDLIFPDS